MESGSAAVADVVPLPRKHVVGAKAARFVLDVWLAVFVAVLAAFLVALLLLVAWGTRRSGPPQHLRLRVGRVQLFHFDRAPGWCRFGLGRDKLQRWLEESSPASDRPPDGGVREPRRPAGPSPSEGSITLDPPS
jgi:hypothetical protein